MTDILYNVIWFLGGLAVFFLAIIVILYRKYNNALDDLGFFAYHYLKLRYGSRDTALEDARRFGLHECEFEILDSDKKRERMISPRRFKD